MNRRRQDSVELALRTAFRIANPFIAGAISNAFYRLNRKGP